MALSRGYYSLDPSPYTHLLQKLMGSVLGWDQPPSNFCKKSIQWFLCNAADKPTAQQMDTGENITSLAQRANWPTNEMITGTNEVVKRPQSTHRPPVKGAGAKTRWLTSVCCTWSLLVPWKYCSNIMTMVNTTCAWQEQVSTVILDMLAWLKALLNIKTASQRHILFLWLSNFFMSWTPSQIGPLFDKVLSQAPPSDKKSGFRCWKCVKLMTKIFTYTVVVSWWSDGNSWLSCSVQPQCHTGPKPNSRTL